MCVPVLKHVLNFSKEVRLDVFLFYKQVYKQRECDRGGVIGTDLFRMSLASCLVLPTSFLSTLLGFLFSER